MRDWLRRLRCVLGGGHLPIVKRGQGRVYDSCFRCNAVLGQGGWRMEAGTPRPPFTVTRTDRESRVIGFSKRSA